MRNVVVTGAASGIGRAVVLRLVTAGDHVWCVDRDESRLEELSAESRGLLGRVSTLLLDVTDEVAVARALETVGAATDGHLDGLVNSAGIIVVGRFEDLQRDDWVRTYLVNVVGSYLMIKAVAGLMRPRGGAIVNVASMAGKLPGTFTAPYNASKAAVISLTRTAAASMAPMIRVNCVCPGVVDTPMYLKLDAELARLNAPEILRHEQRSRLAPLGRPAQPDEIAGAILYLLGPDASYITGEDINVSGGFVMH